jgi:hypothetical protein
MSENGKPETAGEIRFKPNLSLWRYLGWLARHTTLGRDENEVARQVLVDRLSEMRGESYHDGQKS